MSGGAGGSAGPLGLGGQTFEHPIQSCAVQPARFDSPFVVEFGQQRTPPEELDRLLQPPLLLELVEGPGIHPYFVSSEPDAVARRFNPSL